jgi:hypothetical protein
MPLSEMEEFMPNELYKSALAIGKAVPATEAAIDNALLAIANLTSTLVSARLETGVPPSTGQGALVRLAKAQCDLVSVSSDMLRVHGELRKVQREVCAPDVVPGCPKEKGEIVTTPILKVVA